ncbi:hybrid sensor histidine kinase/response regulator [Desulfotignum balticum]|jgi:signal transduction histidine kinase|uniref:hybrid sensor histidine kinase/response regulator n=1 Tax=Desulfotignum balticum TaxID=115781 RepID=UPI0004218E9A|nr:hybrid sensor histidine kinase/response regulator [Desulfotignum balticum]
MNCEHRKPVIMIVDDQPLNLRLFQEIVSNEGYRVLMFSSGPAALRALAKVMPDVILLDIMMPEMDGFDVCRHLKADDRLNRIPVIFISALNDTSNKVRALAEGGVDYVTKPFNAGEVLARIRTHLRIRQQQVQIETQKQQLQESFGRLRELETLRDNLVHMVAHDMRSPLLAVTGYARMILSDLEGAGHDRPAQDAQTILDLCSTLQKMISTLLDISRLEACQMPLNIQPGDAGELISRVVTALGVLADDDAAVVWHPPEEKMTALFDEEITRRILENLLVNAFNFAGKEARVRISAVSAETAIKIMVTDNGPGIAPEHQGHVFEKFSQAPAGQDDAGHSTGLGLAFCKLAMEAQGGEIGVKSEVGKGSTFWFTLPHP